MKALPSSVRFEKETVKRVVRHNEKTGIKTAEIIRAAVHSMSRLSSDEVFAAVMRYRTEVAK